MDRGLVEEGLPLFLSLYWICYNTASVLAGNHVGFQLTDQGLKLHPLLWKAFSTGLPEKSFLKEDFLFVLNHPLLLGKKKIYSVCVCVYGHTMGSMWHDSNYFLFLAVDKWCGLEDQPLTTEDRVIRQQDC